MKTVKKKNYFTNILVLKRSFRTINLKTFSHLCGDLKDWRTVVEQLKSFVLFNASLIIDFVQKRFLGNFASLCHFGLEKEIFEEISEH